MTTPVFTQTFDSESPKVSIQIVLPSDKDINRCGDLMARSNCCNKTMKPDTPSSSQTQTIASAKLLMNSTTY